MEMVELLVKEGVELRHESNIERESLQELCEAVSAATCTFLEERYPIILLIIQQSMFV